VSRENEELERRLQRIEHALRLLARVIVKDENELNDVLQRLSAPTSALSSTAVTVTQA
jgi:DNA-binding FrmR family transcriptional regulator